MNPVVFDTSALLTFLWREPGHELVAQALAQDNGTVSAVNLAELCAKLVDRGFPDVEIDALVADLGLNISPMDATQAKASALLRNTTRSRGLSLGDRACPALAHALGAVALTADRPWLDLDVGVDIRCVRPDKH